METNIEHLVVQAKRKKTQEWIEGSHSFIKYDIASDRHFISTENKVVYEWGNGKIDVSTICYEVDPKTIRRWSGQYDNTGKKIWEGDLFHLGDTKITYTVVWDDNGFKGCQNGNKSFVGLTFWCDKITIIGNIFDTPKYLDVNQD